MVARRGAGHRPLPRARGAGRGAARRHGARRRDRGLARRTRVQPFAELQQRIGRKTLGAEAAARDPGRAARLRPARMAGPRPARAAAGASAARCSTTLVARRAPPAAASPARCSHGDSWADLARQREAARALGVEGMMLKQRDAPYGVGRTKDVGAWWKWKIDPLQRRRGADLRAARPRPARQPVQRLHLRGVGRRRRSSRTRKLVPFAKAYSGLTDAEMARVDAVIRKTTVESFGPVRSVKPTLVFELGFEGIARSTRHKSGIAVRFPRMLRWREDKPVDEADTLETLAALLPRMSAQRVQPPTAALDAWFAARGWKPLRVPARGLAGRSPPASPACCMRPPAPARPTRCGSARCRPSRDADAARATATKVAPPLTVLWITPMRALAADTLRALQQPLDALAAALERRRAQRRHRAARAQRAEPAPADRAGHHAREPVAAAVARRRARGARHACAWWSSTNGTSCSATSAACRCSWRWRGCGAGTRRCASGACRPRWATCSEALRHAARRTAPARWCRARCRRSCVIDSLLPGRAERFPWAGHLGPDDAAAGDRRDRSAAAPRWSSPTRARSPRSGTRRCSRRGPTGPG